MILWMAWTRTWLRGGRFLNTTLQAAVQTIIQWNWKTDRWTKNYWCKHQKISKMLRACRQAYCVKKLLRSQTPMPTSSPTQCSVWENGRLSYCNLEEQNLMVFGKQSLQVDMNRIDDTPTEFEWKIFPRITTLGLLEKIQNLMRELQCEPEHFEDKIIFTSMYKTLHGEKKIKYRKMWIQFTDSCGMVFLGTQIRKEMVRNPHWKKTDGSWDKIAENMMANFLRIQSSNISCLQCLWERRIEKQKTWQEVWALQR